MSKLGHVLDFGMGRCIGYDIKLLNAPETPALGQVMKWPKGND